MNWRKIWKEEELENVKGEEEEEWEESEEEVIDKLEEVVVPNIRKSLRSGNVSEVNLFNLFDPIKVLAKPNQTIQFLLFLNFCFQLKLDSKLMIKRKMNH